MGGAARPRLSIRRHVLCVTVTRHPPTRDLRNLLHKHHRRLLYAYVCFRVVIAAACMAWMGANLLSPVASAAGPCPTVTQIARAGCAHWLRSDHGAVLSHMPDTQFKDFIHC